MRRPWLAFLLSLFLPGLGQLYAREPLRAVVAVVWVAALMPPALVALIAHMSTSASGLLLALGLCLGLYLLIPIDAAVMAHWNRDLPRAWYNRLGAYLAFAALLGLVSFSARASVPRTLWYRLFRVPSVSMAPTLIPGDHIVGDMRMVQLRRGEVVLLQSPSGILVAKRLVGMPGDSVELRGGELWINGSLRARGAGPGAAADRGPRRERLEAGEYTVWTAHDPRADHGPVTVPPQHGFVLGDNRPESRDSREWGTVPLDTVRGRMVRVHLSFAPEGERDAAGILGIRWGRIGSEPFEPIDARGGG